MKKKAYDDDFENEFDVDEPEELQDQSDDDWAPAKKGGGAKRASTGKRGGAGGRKKAKKESSDEDDDEDEPPARKKKAPAAKPKTPAKSPAKGKGKKAKEEEEDDDEDVNEEEDEDEELEDEELDEEEEEEDEPSADGTQKAPKEFSSGAFVILKTDFESGGDPPIWKIDGKALLQKYVPFDQDGKKLYKNTSVYSGWTINNKEQYYPATVVFKQQSRKEHVVEFQRDLIQVDKPEDGQAAASE